MEAGKKLITQLVFQFNIFHVTKLNLQKRQKKMNAWVLPFSLIIHAKEIPALSAFRSVWLISPNRFQFTEVVEVTFTCAFNYTAFPFDEQVRDNKPQRSTIKQFKLLFNKETRLLSYLVHLDLYADFKVPNLNNINFRFLIIILLRLS